MADSTSGQIDRKLSRLSTPSENGFAVALAGDSCSQDQLPSYETAVLLAVAKSAAVIGWVIGLAMAAEGEAEAAAAVIGPVVPRVAATRSMSKAGMSKAGMSTVGR